MSELGKEIAGAVVRSWSERLIVSDLEVAAADAAIAPLVEVLREDVQWDGYHESEVPAVWLGKAEAILARATGDA